MSIFPCICSRQARSASLPSRFWLPLFILFIQYSQTSSSQNLPALNSPFHVHPQNLYISIIEFLKSTFLPRCCQTYKKGGERRIRACGPPSRIVACAALHQSLAHALRATSWDQSCLCSFLFVFCFCEILWRRRRSLWRRRCSHWKRFRHTSTPGIAGWSSAERWPFLLSWSYCKSEQVVVDEETSVPVLGLGFSWDLDFSLLFSSIYEVLIAKNFVVVDPFDLDRKYQLWCSFFTPFVLK